MSEHQMDMGSSGQEKEILEILMDSDLYLELPLKERHLLFKHIVNTFMEICLKPKTGSC